MPSRLDSEIITLLSEGIILLDAKGDVIDSNKAGRAALAQWGPVDLQLLKVAVIEANGGGRLPRKLHFMGSGSQSEDCFFFSRATLCDNGPDQYALVTEDGASKRHQRLGDASGAMLIGGGMRQQLRDLADTIGQLHSRAQDAGLSLGAATGVQQMLRQVCELAELQQRDETFSSDRFQPGVIVRGLVPRLPLRDGEITCVISDVNESAAIYGEKAWFERAMQTLLTRLCNGCPPKGRVKIDIRQTGDFVSIFGHVSTDTMRYSSLVRPPQKKGQLRPERLNSEIVKRIIELHGGLLKIKMLDSGFDGDSAAIDSFSISLPTGVPADDRSRVSCAKCRITLQSEQYARDLVYLAEDSDHSPEQSIERITQ